MNSYRTPGGPPLDIATRMVPPIAGHALPTVMPTPASERRLKRRESSWACPDALTRTPGSWDVVVPFSVSTGSESLKMALAFFVFHGLPMQVKGVGQLFHKLSIAGWQRRWQIVRLGFAICRSRLHVGADLSKNRFLLR